MRGGGTAIQALTMACFSHITFDYSCTRTLNIILRA